jgi:hypothetical protein
MDGGRLCVTMEMRGCLVGLYGMATRCVPFPDVPAPG